MSKRATFDRKPMTFHESLHYCGCPGCVEEIRQRLASEPPLKPDFAAYLIAQYPATAHLIASTTTQSQPTPEGREERS